ncbi:MAG: DNA phosphorothioation system sulfurtransferase DndC [Polyangiaceae bacterium]|nr:DNA phosphorothioation system sulfurtransferase DndC [Polyangiaceae bacterium]
MEHSHLLAGEQSSSELEGVNVGERLRRAQAELLSEYLDDRQGFPWIVGYSGGKDSTLVLQLVVEMLLSIPPMDRARPVHVLANDTLVESPLLSSYLQRMMGLLEDAAVALRLPLTVVTTRPEPHQTFWVNLIGRGYPSPNRMFRWCTDRMKIRPTSKYIVEQVESSGRAILLLGVRRDESAVRAASVDRYRPREGSRLNPHNDLRGCLVYRPIVDFSTEEVWELLLQRPPPWGGSHRDLVTLYRNAQGGECPLVLGKDDAPSCGTSSARFGCWTCTVVEKDRSIEGFIDAGFDDLEPLMFFRDWLASIRNDRSRRLRERRNGVVTLMADGSPVPGPFTLETRREVLSRLLELQEEVSWPLISSEEIEHIHRIWADDAATDARRLVATLQKAGVEK